MTRLTAVGRSLDWMRDELSPTPDDKARLRALIVAPAMLLSPSLADAESPLPARAAVAELPLTRWAALKTAGALGVAAGSVLLGVGGGIGFWLGRDTSAPQVVEVQQHAPRAMEAVPPRAEPPPSDTLAPVVAPAPEVISAAPPEAHRVEKAVRPRATRPAPNPLNDELALLRRVERALRNNEPALAVALLGELDQRFPASRLVEERLAARRIAECRLGEPGAMTRAQAFLHEHSTSVYRQRVQLACVPAEAESAPAGQPLNGSPERRR